MATSAGRKGYLARRERDRQASFDRIARQVAAGTLTIRKMTPEERERWGPPQPRDDKAERKRKRQRSLAVPHAGEQLEDETEAVSEAQEDE